MPGVAGRSERLPRLPRALYVAVLLAAIAWIVWSARPRQRSNDAPILEAVVAPMSLEVMLNRACNASRIEHEVVESPMEVRVKVVAHDAALSEDCGMETTIELAEPLGSRRLVDGATGESLRCGQSEGRTVCEPPPG